MTTEVDEGSPKPYTQNQELQTHKTLEKGLLRHLGLRGAVGDILQASTILQMDMICTFGPYILASPVNTP